MFSPFGRNNRGQNIAGVEAAAQGIFGVSAKDFVCSTSGLYRWLATKSDCLLSYAADGSLKSKENLELGLARAKRRFVQYVPDGNLVEKDYGTYAQ